MKHNSLPTHRAPTHPGEMLLHEFLEPAGMTQAEFARHIGWTPAKLSEIIKGKRGLTPETALCLADATNMSPAFWLGLQSDYDLWHALKKHQHVPTLAPFQKVS